MNTHLSSTPTLWEQWRQPSPEYRGKPFWSWNGTLATDELLRQIDVFKEMGMGGYFMHSRTGLQTEYLGREWFECINACADAGAERGMESWLYDEDRWPSGSAGGLATRDPRYRMRYLRLMVYAKGGGDVDWPEPDHFVAAFTANLDGLDLVSYQKIDYKTNTDADATLLVFSWEYAPEHSFYNGAAYLDTMNREATDHFMHVTHDAYAEACGERLGTSIKGIFTDEPHRGFVFCQVHGQPGVPDPGWTTPWTSSLPKAFEAAFGYDLRDRLPELFLRVKDEHLNPVKWAYMELCQTLFLENWAKPLQQRCRDLGLILTGHILHEDSLAAQAVPCGSVMRYYPFLDYPGVDVLNLRNTNYWVVKQLSSVARQLDQPWLLSELYGCTGWQTDFTDHKRIGDWQALFGINLRCHHLSWYSMAGEAKRDYPASIAFQSAWYPEYKAVETYFSRLHVLLKAGRPVCDVLVLNPVESLWSQIRVNWATWLSATDENVRRLEQVYQDVFTELCGAQVDFDYGDEAHLGAHGAVAKAERQLVLGSMRYGVVVVAGMETMRASTLKLLREFQAAGGTVIFAGAPPTHVDALPSSAPAQLSAQCITVPLNGTALGAQVRASSAAAQKLRLDKNGAGLFCQVRTDGERCIVVLLNPSETRQYDKVTVRLRNPGPVTELDCLKGDALQTSAKTHPDGTLTWETSFRPLQERTFICGVALPESKPPLPPLKTPFEAIEGSFAYSLDEPNIAVLDTAAFAVDDGEWETAQEILQIEKILSERLGIPLRGGQMVQPWAAKGRILPAKTRLRLRFRFVIDDVPDTPVRLALEQPENFTIAINGRPLANEVATDWFIDPSLRTLPVPADTLRAGENVIELSSIYQQGVDLEAIFLLGAFGVVTAGGRVRLTTLPDQLEPGDWTQQGLPFYSGRICLTIPVGNARRLQMEPFGAATLVVRHPGSDKQHILPWPPYTCDLDGLVDDDGQVCVEWVLTRRNTFGPLHLIPIDQPHIAPHHFRTEGAAWSDAHQLIPTGLGAAPSIQI